MLNTSVIGVGLIGQAWAIVFARAGCNVCLWDDKPEALPMALSTITSQLKTLQSVNLVDEPEVILSRIKLATSLDDALSNTEYVQENLPETLQIKLNIFRQIDAVAPPEAIVASSTSSIPSSSFTEALSGRHRCLVVHPVNPPYLIPVVEICGAPWTDPQVISRTRLFMEFLKQKPVTVNDEVEGFVLNRLQGALLREAFRLVERGVVSVEDLDRTVRDGLGLRWSFMDPFETIDLNAPNGLQDYCKRYGDMYQKISLEQISIDQWTDDVIANAEQQRRALLPCKGLSERRSWRDSRLMALIQHKKQFDES